jgi:hypothetical protein
MDYNVTGDFKKAPLGPFTEANKRLVWPALTYDADKTGKYFSIVEDSRFPGGRACRMFYPQSSYGMKDQYYQIRVKSPQTICNLEFLFLFEDNFSFYTPVQGGDGGGGKIGPCINWGEVGGEDAKRGTRCMIWWNSHGSKKDNECVMASCQDQRSGNQLLQPIVYSKKIVTNALYKFRIQMRGGPAAQAFAKYFVTYPGETAETPLGEVKGKDMMATATDDVIYDFAFFSGGASTAYSPEWDSYTRHGGIRYWSGESATGNGDEGSGGDGDITPPTPPAGATSPFSIAVGETRVFRARFFDTSVSPPKEIPAGGTVKWSLSPNNVSWGAEAGPNWSAIEVKGKTAGGPCTLIATDPSTGISTVPVQVDITAEPREAGTVGFCTVESQ